METRPKKSAGVKGSKKSTEKNRILLISLLCAVVVLGGTILGIHFYGVHQEKQRLSIVESQTFRTGISVSGVDISGMTYDEAKAALASVETELTSGVGFTLKCEGSTYELDKACFDITYNTDSILDEAFAFARTGELDELNAELEDIKTNGRIYTVEYEISPDQQAIDTVLNAISDKVDTDPVDATFVVHQLETNEDTQALNAVDVGLPESGTATDLRDIRFDFTEAVPGYGVDRDALNATIAQRTSSRDFGEIDVPLSDIEADVTIASIKDNLVLRSSATTSFKSSKLSYANRVFNMKKACGKIYGTVLQPGDILSCNTLLGDRTEKLGWALAGAIVDGGAGTEDQAGGGVCQISTTMYNAVLKADMEVVYRRGHSSKSAYVDGGLDATINTGTIDFQWANNTESPVYVFVWMNSTEKTINCEIYGQPFPDTFDEIKQSSELVETIEVTADVYEEVSWLYSPYWSLKNSSKKGYTYKTSVTYYKNGEVVDTKVIDTTTYKMHPNRYYVWVGYMGEPLLSEYQYTVPDN